jgi:hypothetical protein
VILLNTHSKCWRAPSDAIHRLNIDNDGEIRVFETAKWQAVSGKRGGALGRRHRERVIVEPPSPTSSRAAADYTFLADSRTDAFSFNFDGVKNLSDTGGKRNFTELHLI